MFDLKLPWWELPVRATIIYVALLVLVRISGRRTVGQFTAFDLMVVMLLSEAVSNGLGGGEQSVTGALLAAVTLVGLNMTIAFVTTRSQKMQFLVEGRAVLLGRDGVLFGEVLKHCRVPESDVHQALREADCDLKDMRFAFLEVDGQISVLKDSSGAVTDGTRSG